MKDCVSLEIAKKLKEAGWKQAQARQLDGGYIFPSSFYYAPYSGDSEIWPLFYQGEWREALKDNDINNFVACPSIGELLEAFDHETFSVSVGSDFYEEGKRLVYRGHLHRYQDFENDDVEGEESPNPADALALLWMALKDKGIL